MVMSVHCLLFKKTTRQWSTALLIPSHHQSPQITTNDPNFKPGYIQAPPNTTDHPIISPICPAHHRSPLPRSPNPPAMSRASYRTPEQSCAGPVTPVLSIQHCDQGCAYAGALPEGTRRAEKRCPGLNGALRPSLVLVLG